GFIKIKAFIFSIDRFFLESLFPVNPSTAKIDIWSDILDFLSRRLNQHIFDSWFRPIHFESIDNDQKIIKLRAGKPTI
ncbi:hypothetical protein OFM04_37000, partial [Escherichia coli]|nr:hypothetical protein [Escherichia coli]